mmetsp:Transcript_19625/g.19914  ORF Transcript_19625/g.19914 Transcript_19625/m.19914 type:complete len:85 (+) Transcript_19625:1334-1588(+)
MLLYAHVWLMLKTLYDCHFLIGADMNADEPPKSVSVVGVMIGVCGAAVLIVGGAFKKLQGKYEGQEPETMASLHQSVENLTQNQ